MRITRKVFHDLAIWMVGFGLTIGVVFPFFVLLLGVPSTIALNKVFFSACLGAGALAGIINYTLARWIVGVRIRILADSMSQVEQNLDKMTYSGDFSDCTPETCMITVDSEDEIGESALAFNHLVDALSKSMETQIAVLSFSEMLSSQLEIRSLAENALLQFFEHTDAAAGLILYEANGELKLAASQGLKNPELLAAGEHVKGVIRSGRKQLITPVGSQWDEAVGTDLTPREVIVVPVNNKNVLLGVVVLASDQIFDAGHHARIDLFIQGLGLALTNAMAHENLQRLAALDPLTDIYNRRFGMGRLEEEFARADRSRSLLGVLIFDIDHFKAVNDTYGHFVGDRVLKSVCSIARTSLRQGDILFRYGGEEFVAILPAATTEDLRVVSERLRRSVEDSTVTDGSNLVRVTISIGGAAYPNQDVDDMNLLLQLADGALFEAKDSGRNCVVIVQS